MNELFSGIRGFLSFDLLIYAAIVLVLFAACIRCVLPLSGVARQLRKASRIIITENKQRKERKSWRSLEFMGGKLESIWADYLQNAEQREAHGETCDVAGYIHEDAILYAVGVEEFAELAPGLLTSLGILGTFLGLVRGLSGLSLNAADTQALLGAMEQLVGGMSTAFLTSIAGVSASLLFNLLYHRQASRCKKAIDRFCEVFSLYAMPKPVSDETSIITQQQEQTTYLRQAAQEIGEKLSTQIENSILRAMTPVQRSMDNFVLAATQAQAEGMDRVVQLFIQRMNVTLAGEVDRLKQALHEAGSVQQLTQEEMKAASDAIAQMARDVINMQQMTQGLLEHFQAYVSGINQSSTAIEQQQQQTADTLNQLASQAKDQAVLLDAIMAKQKALAEHDRSYAKTTEEFFNAAAHLSRDTVNDIQSACASLRESTRALSDAGASWTRQAALSPDQALQMKESLNTLAKNTQLLQGSIDAWLKQHDGTERRS